jgi:hypothetical protein
MAQQKRDLELRASDKTLRELAETDLERVAAGKEGNHGWFSIYYGKNAVREAQLHPSPEVI